jgi:HEAT repeat protein
MKPELKEAIRQLLDVLDRQNQMVKPRAQEALEHLKIQQSLKILRRHLEK